MSMSSLANGRSQAMHLHQTHRLTLSESFLHLACLISAPGSLLLHHAQKTDLLPGMTAACLGQTSQACCAEGSYYSRQAISCPLLPSCCTWSPIALQGLARQHSVVAI